MKTLRYIRIIIIWISGLVLSNAQSVLIDQGINAGDLWCFPILHNEDTYLYLPQRARLSLKNDSLPEFSLVRYVMENETGSETKTISEAAGGGILNFLVLYDTPEEMIGKAQQHLRRTLKNDSVTLRGPIVFDKGKYTLVSSILNPSTNKEERHILASGEAPILENSKIALSFDVDPVKSKLLLESFKMSTPDVSLVFELEFSGLTDNYEAEIEIDWSEIKESNAFEAGGSIYFVGADVKLGFDDLRRNNAIKFTSVGSSTSMENLVQTVYEKLLELMFRPTPMEQVPEGARGGLEDALGALISSDGSLSSRNMTGFGLNVAYQYKQHNSTGKSHMTFNGRNLVHRNHYITFNAGNLYKKYGNNREIFKDINLSDPAFQQRDVYVGIDGTVEREFDKMLNSVTVKLSKKHQNGDETIREVLLTKDSYKTSNGRISMKYLNHRDTLRNEWLNYDYKTTWKFIGGGTYSEDWKTENAAMINLYTPFERRKIELTGNPETLKEQNIRAVSVGISYDFFGDPKNSNLTIYPQDNLSEKFFEITVPKGVETVDYSITWFVKDAEPIKKTGTDAYGLIFIDEMPQ